MLELTYRCNLDDGYYGYYGYYGYNDRASTGQPLSVAQYDNLLEALRELGATHLTFSGSSPLARGN